MITKKQFSQKIKKDYDIYMLKLMITECENIKMNELKHLSKEELIDRAYKHIENLDMLRVMAKKGVI